MSDARAARLTLAELDAELARLPGWQAPRGTCCLTRTFTFPAAEDGYRALGYFAAIAPVVEGYRPMLTASAEAVHVLLPASPAGLTHEHLDFAHAAEVIAAIFATDLQGEDEREGRFPACTVVPFRRPLTARSPRSPAPPWADLG